MCHHVSSCKLLHVIALIAVHTFCFLLTMRLLDDHFGVAITSISPELDHIIICYFVFSHDNLTILCPFHIAKWCSK